MLYADLMFRRATRVRIIVMQRIFSLSTNPLRWETYHCYGRLAQLVLEHSAHNRTVVGSSPTSSIKKGGLSGLRTQKIVKQRIRPKAKDTSLKEDNHKKR